MGFERQDSATILHPLAVSIIILTNLYTGAFRLLIPAFQLLIQKTMSNYGTILVVDDNPGVLTALKICLGGVFEKVITMPSPDGMLAILSQEHVDMVLLDMNFGPGVNSGQEGLVWLRAIRKRNADVPVVLMTAYADVQLAVRGLKTGATDFVTKPWDNDDLLRILKDAIDRSKEVVPLDQMEVEHVRKVVDRCHGNISRAAELLGITRQTLYAKMKKLRE